MKLLLSLLASALTVSAACQQESGNYYCSSTTKITYSGLGYSGSYQDVTSMSESGSCSRTSYAFSGALSPLDEELSIHFRGPIELKQFAVYYPASNNNKREEDCATTLVHKHHKHKRATVINEVTQTIYVDANGVTQTTTGAPAATSAPALVPGAEVAPSSVVAGGAPVASQAAPVASSASAPTAATSASSQSSGSSSAPVAAGDWSRTSYYTPGTATNLVFMGNYGGSGSGVWSSGLGNSISYLNSAGSGGASSPAILDDVLIPSNKEFMIFSGSKCSGNDCGYYREGIPAYHGFGGNQKIFLFEFTMPSAGSSSKRGFNEDMPAIWALNAKIPRTLQYGNGDCSCWNTGCGEADFFEVLNTGNNKMISHVHTGQGASNGVNNGGGGSSDYFDRPTSGTMKGAAILNGSDLIIMKLDDDFDFGSSLSQSTVNSLLSQSGSTASIGY